MSKQADVLERHIPGNPSAVRYGGVKRPPSVQEERCFGLCREACCGLSYCELVGSFVIALPVSVWVRISAAPWLQEHGVLDALQRGGFTAASQKLGTELSSLAHSQSSADWQSLLTSLLIWINKNPWMFLLYSVLVVAVISAADVLLTRFCCAGSDHHSHSHSHHGHSHGPDGECMSELEAIEKEVQQERKQLEAAGAPAPPPAKADSKPASPAPEPVRYHVKDPVLLLKRKGQWPPPTDTIIGGPTTAIDEAIRQEQAQGGGGGTNPDAAVRRRPKSKSKSKTKK
jgi:hypothetical protein